VLKNAERIKEIQELERQKKRKRRIKGLEKNGKKKGI